MRCPSCDADLPDDARFCIECGATLKNASTGPTVHLQREEQGVSVCAACGSANPDHAIFCVRCGQRMGDPAPRPVPPPPLINGDVIPAPPALPSFSRNTQPAMGRPRDSEMASVAAFMIGLGVLFFFFSRFFWPGILIVIGVSNLVRFVGRGNVTVGVRNVLWLFGLAFLFMMPQAFFPGILVLIGLSAIIEALIRSTRRP
jgi:hypothetical protein